jgi:hypothetical protein
LLCPLAPTSSCSSCGHKQRRGAISYICFSSVHKLNRYVYACASHTISVFCEGFVVDSCNCLAKIVVCSSLSG